MTYLIIVKDSLSRLVVRQLDGKRDSELGELEHVVKGEFGNVPAADNDETNI